MDVECQYTISCFRKYIAIVIALSIHKSCKCFGYCEPIVTTHLCFRHWLADHRSEELTSSSRVMKLLASPDTDLSRASNEGLRDFTQRRPLLATRDRQFSYHRFVKLPVGNELCYASVPISHLLAMFRRPFNIVS